MTFLIRVFLGKVICEFVMSGICDFFRLRICEFVSLWICESVTLSTCYFAARSFWDWALFQWDFVPSRLWPVKNTEHAMRFIELLCSIWLIDWCLKVWTNYVEHLLCSSVWPATERNEATQSNKGFSLHDKNNKWVCLNFISWPFFGKQYMALSKCGTHFWLNAFLPGGISKSAWARAGQASQPLTVWSFHCFIL